MELKPVNIVCPVCGSGKYMRHLIGKNVGYLDIKCINCNSYFNFDELYKRRIGEVLKSKPVTNADRIRAMSDEELAEWLAEHQKIGDAETHRDGYRQLWLDWLKQEAQEDE